jgi:hypothetical protein
MRSGLQRPCGLAGSSKIGAQVGTESIANRSLRRFRLGSLTLNCPFALLSFVFEVAPATRAGHYR